MEWLQEPNQSGVDNLSNVGLEASRHFRNKKKNIRKLKLTNFKLAVRTDIPELYRCIIECKKGYQFRTDTVKDRKVGGGGLVYYSLLIS